MRNSMKGCVLQIRISAAQKSRLIRTAADSDTTVSELVRYVASLSSTLGISPDLLRVLGDTIRRNSNAIANIAARSTMTDTDRLELRRAIGAMREISDRLRGAVS